jgi:hypothetical protein
MHPFSRGGERVSERTPLRSMTAHSFSGSFGLHEKELVGGRRTADRSFRGSQIL